MPTWATVTLFIVVVLSVAAAVQGIVQYFVDDRLKRRGK